jgi:protein phosphatase 2C family protein 2/3
MAESNNAMNGRVPGTFDKSGSCAIIVLLVENNCYVANVGDSRAVMSAVGGQKLFVLSRDHRPNEDTER